MYLLIDNYDSFTYNLYQAFAEQGIKVFIKRNDKISLEEIVDLNPDKIIISPGPKTPGESGISVDVIRYFGKSTAILGICLGHQCIASAFGAKIARIGHIVHGSSSPIYHNGKGIFKGLPNPFAGARYHSLEARELPDDIKITARTDDNIIMGIEHRYFPVIGLQFHPESFLTPDGQKIIKNFIDI